MCRLPHDLQKSIDELFLPPLCYSNHYSQKMASKTMKVPSVKKEEDCDLNENNSEENLYSRQLQKQHISDISNFGVFVKDISQNIALVFNKLIYSVACMRKKAESSSGQTKTKRTGPTTVDLVKIEEQEQQLVKVLKKRRKKGQQDQTKPKRPVSSFFIFYKDKIKDLQPKKGDPGFKMAEAIASAWNALSQQEQKPYKQRSKAQRDRYERQMREYFEIYGQDIEKAKIEKIKMKKIKKQFGEQGQQQEVQKQIKNKLKGISLKQVKTQQRKQYPHRPKAPQSSFFAFYRSQSKKLIEKYNVSEGQKISKIAASVWKQMTEQQKLPYEIKTREEREKYHEAMRQYRMKYPQEVEKRRQVMSLSMKRNHLGLGKKKMEKHTFDSSESSEVSHEKIDVESKKSGNQKKKSKLKKLPQAKKKSCNFLLPHKPRGSVSAFFHFYQMNLTKFSRTLQGFKIPGCEIVKKASAYWRDLPDIEKDPYFKLAKSDHERYQLELQEYEKQYPEEYALFMKTITNRTQVRNAKNAAKNEQKQGVKQEEISEPPPLQESGSDSSSSDQQK